MDAPCLRFCWSFFHLMALCQTWQLLSSAWCPAHLRFLCSIQWIWVMFWCSSELADSSNLHWNVNYWAVSQDVRARMAIAKWLSTFGLKSTGLVLWTTLSAVIGNVLWCTSRPRDAAWWVLFSTLRVAKKRTKLSSTCWLARVFWLRVQQ